MKVRIVSPINDLLAVSRIDAESNPHPWSVELFVEVLRRDKTNCLIVEDYGEIQGYILYEVLGESVALRNFAVERKRRRCGRGTLLIESAKACAINRHRRNIVTAAVPDTCTAAHMLLQRCNFYALRIVRGVLGAEDCYFFESKL